MKPQCRADTGEQLGACVARSRPVIRCCVAHLPEYLSHLVGRGLVLLVVLGEELSLRVRYCVALEHAGETRVYRQCTVDIVGNHPMDKRTM